jgi:hypothetical protein
MSRVPGTYTHRDLRPNPAYAGREPSPQRAICHDGTPFITVFCRHCGEGLHMHESSLLNVPAEAEVESRCPSCRRTLLFEPGFFAAAFAQLREQGWVE